MENSGYLHQAIHEVYYEILSQRDDICKCQQCKSHILQHVSNHLAPQYKDKHSDTTHMRKQSIDSQVKIDATIKISRLIDEMKNNPIH